MLLAVFFVYTISDRFSSVLLDVYNNFVSLGGEVVVGEATFIPQPVSEPSLCPYPLPFPSCPVRAL